MDPVALFRDLAAQHRRLFWLDGAGGRDWSGRRSVLGGLAEEDISLTYDASRRLVHRHGRGRSGPAGDDIFCCLETELARDRDDPDVWWVGYFGYASRPDLPATAGGPAPDAVWMRARRPVLLEHPGPAATATTGAEAPALTDRAEPPPAEYLAAFHRVQRELRRGNSYEVNLTYREAVLSDRDPVSTYLRLRALSPAPYAGYLRHGDTHVLSSSPERFATVDRSGWVETRPIKGTTPRGETDEEDERQRVRLERDPRFRAENLMVVDLLRNDLAHVCVPGTVAVPELMRVESYRGVHQLVSTVRGRLDEGTGTLQALRALFPAGSMTGAPKLRTMEIIRAVESTPRGVYAGAHGWIRGDGSADLGVVIRTLVATPAGRDGGGLRWRYELGTGGGITVRSEPEEEYRESRWKVARLLQALR